MRKPLKQYLNKITGIPVTIISLILVPLIGILDYLSGFELSFSIFYLLPVGFVAWYAGLAATMSVCVILKI